MAIAFSAVALSACGDDKPRQQNGSEAKPIQSATGCLACHPVTLDDAHNQPCTSCHRGNMAAATRDEAHSGLIAEPAHPLQMMNICGPCHSRTVESVAHSLHFTLKNELNLVRGAFGAKEELDSLIDLQTPEKIASLLNLADDLLKRRCLMCHPYSAGDTYPETIRGTGCASCHLHYVNGSLQSHVFARTPSDRQCLHCHYGNYVGADYYGRFEHDFSYEFRTPYRTDEIDSRPYGIEYHQLAPDIHQQAGMACVDCHSASQLMGADHAQKDMIPGKPASTLKPVTCEGCHTLKPGAPLPLSAMRESGNVFEIITAGGAVLSIPQATHPAHATFAEKADCLVCHAQWAYTDKGTHLMRHDGEDYAPWTLLTVQGSHTVEDQLENSWDSSYGYDFPAMPDTVAGRVLPGIWFKGYELRRWDFPLIGADEKGRFRVLRPILDIHLSYKDQDGAVHFDSVPSERAAVLRPYTPHTVGKAGAFYRMRLRDNRSAYFNINKLFLEK